MWVFLEREGPLKDDKLKKYEKGGKFSKHDLE